MEMFTHNEGARNEVARTRRIDELTHKTARPRLRERAGSEIFGYLPVVTPAAVRAPLSAAGSERSSLRAGFWTSRASWVRSPGCSFR